VLLASRDAAKALRVQYLVTLVYLDSARLSVLIGNDASHLALVGVMSLMTAGSVCRLRQGRKVVLFDTTCGGIDGERGGRLID